MKYFHVLCDEFHDLQFRAQHCKFDLTLPLKSSFTGNAVLDFRKTAFDNGRFMPVYSDDALCYGMYGYELSNVTMFSTEFNIAYHYKLLSLTAGWHSNWIDVPVLESPQMILLNASFMRMIRLACISISVACPCVPPNG